MKKNKRTVVSEKQITDNIRKFLKIKRVFHWKQWQGPMSQPKGVSDILGTYHGCLLAIEVKTATGKVSPHQERFIKNVNDNGGIAFVARSVDDVRRALEIVDEHWKKATEGTII